MNNTPQGYVRPLSIILLIIVCLSVIFFVFKSQILNLIGKIQAPKRPTVDNVIPITQIEDKSIPEGIPTGIITEKNIEVVQSYTAKVGDKVQYTYQYLSTQSIDNSVKAFEEYLEKNKWGMKYKQDLQTGINYSYVNVEGSLLNINSVVAKDSSKYLITITLIKKIN